MSVKRSSSLARIGRLRCFSDCKDRVDYDYLDKLSDAEVAWLAEFSDDYCTGPGAKRYSRRSDVSSIMSHKRVDFKQKDEPKSPSPEEILLALEKKGLRL